MNEISRNTQARMECVYHHQRLRSLFSQIACTVTGPGREGRNENSWIAKKQTRIRQKGKSDERDIVVVRFFWGLADPWLMRPFLRENCTNGD